MHKKTITLGLQGGGAHGAFTWGVLDRLLEEEAIDIEGISGASAGAMNAVVMAHGLTVGGREGARQALKDFWDSISLRLPFSIVPEHPGLANDLAAHSELPVSLRPLLALPRYFSPYQLNPFDINPLREVLLRQVDFERLRIECPVRLFIATTQVSTGTLKLFRNKQLTVDVLLASACLPLLHHAIEIHGEVYWDGGLTSNPPLFPLISKCAARDMMVVLLNPEPTHKVPKTADEILHRLTEMGFSSSFFTELQALTLAQREARRGWLAFGRIERRLRQLNLHVIESQQLMGQLGKHSKMNVKPAFLLGLHEEGRARASRWLASNAQALGTRSSFRLSRLFA